MRSHLHNARGFLLVHRNWYEILDEPNPLLRNAIVSTLNPDAFMSGERVRIVKQGFDVLEPSDEVPFAFTICECRPLAHQPFESLEDAQKFLRELGVKHPHIGFNPIG
jgi:hypothetical protein